MSSDKKELEIENIEQIPVEDSPEMMYIFDRDDTLGFDTAVQQRTEWNLINPQVILPLIRTINKTDNAHWGMASAGGITFQEDPVGKRISAQVSNLKEPSYALINSVSTLLNKQNIQDVSNIEIFEGDEPKDLSDNVDIAQLIIDTVVNRANGEDKVEFNTAYNLPQYQNKQYSFKLSEDSCFTFKFGATEIVVNAKRFADNLDNYSKGQFKLFFILMALEQAKKRPLVTEGLKALGIVEISAPENYKPIDPKNVVFLDDRPNNCEIANQAGFTAIEADTHRAYEKKKYKTKDTYLDEMIETLPKPMQLIFQEEYFIENTTDINKKLIADLDKYIARASKDYYDFKFPFFKRERGVQRHANCELARLLRKEIINGKDLGNIFNENRVKELRNDGIDKAELKGKKGYRDTDVNSSELNKIIRLARKSPEYVEPIKMENHKR